MGDCYSQVLLLHAYTADTYMYVVYGEAAWIEEVTALIRGSKLCMIQSSLDPTLIPSTKCLYDKHCTRRVYVQVLLE